MHRLQHFLALSTISAPLILNFAAANISTQPAATTSAQPNVKAGSKADANAPVRAVVSIPPLKSIVESLLPDGSTVEVIIPPGVSEHGYEPPPSILRSTLKADVVIVVGRGIEPSVHKFLLDNPRADRLQLTLADFAVGVGEISEASEHKHDHDDHEGHDHNHEHNHNHGTSDPHVWLDAGVMKRFVTALDARLNPDTTEPSQRAVAVINRIDAVDAAYAEVMRTAARKVCVVGHDAWSIVSKRYNFTTIPIAGLHASEPTPKTISAAATAAREHGATMLLVEPQISDRVAQRIAATAKLEIGTIDALGNGDWFVMMERNLSSFAKAFGSTVPPKIVSSPAP